MPPINPYTSYQYPPVGYSAFQPYQQPLVQVSQQNDVYVHGEQAAQSYPIQPGSTLRLWDDTADIFYMKTADQAGNVTIRTFNYTERGTTQPAQAQPDFQEAIDKLDDKFQRQINRLNSIIGNLRKGGENDG